MPKPRLPFGEPGGYVSQAASHDGDHCADAPDAGNESCAAGGLALPGLCGQEPPRASGAALQRRDAAPESRRRRERWPHAQVLRGLAQHRGQRELRGLLHSGQLRAVHAAVSGSLRHALALLRGRAVQAGAHAAHAQRPGGGRGRGRGDGERADPQRRLWGGRGPLSRAHAGQHARAALPEHPGQAVPAAGRAAALGPQLAEPGAVWEPLPKTEVRRRHGGGARLKARRPRKEKDSCSVAALHGASKAAV
mmetsp:Transcript_115391/g.337411  ORF Transcript_115391/g.337411 Transcript_115391/m.337411 type:complete len:250 (+) Transcript_115391:1091-1840(+)